MRNALNIKNQSWWNRTLQRWLGYGLVLIVLLPLLAACMGDDDDDEPTAPGAGTTPTEIVATPTEEEGATTETEAPSVETPTEAEPTAPEATEEATATEAEATPTQQTDVPTLTETEPAVPGDLPIDEQMSWLLAILNAEEAPTAEEVEPRMHPSFVAAITPADFAGQMAQLGQSGPWEFSGYFGEPVGLDGTAVITSNAGQLQVLVGLEVPEPHRFQTLLFVPYSEPGQSFESFEEFDSWLSNQAPQVSFQAAEITDGTCQPIYTHNADDPLAVASTFKLWVLLELAERVAAGELSWDDELPIADELKSLPSGTLQTEPAGSSIALSTYAAKMIVLSDNTATDHLMDFLGREIIEERMAETGNAAMDRNMPLLYTQELFYLKLVASAAQREEYIAADDAGQREILNNLTIDFTQADPNALNTPIAVDTIEWFASAATLCQLQTELYVAAQSDETLHAIMAASTGANLDSETWPFVAFKGGNEAGVASGAWLLEHADGRLFSVTVALNNPDAGVDPNQLRTIIVGVAALLADAT